MESGHGKLCPAGTIIQPPVLGILTTIPLELWLSIFPYLNDKDLRVVTRVCSTFRELAQPLLFHVLDICPFFLAYNSDRAIYRPRQYLQTTLERLEFYKSPRIAVSVTELWVSPYARHGFPARQLTDDLDPTLVISAIIDALPAFPNLRALTWHCINIRPSWWSVIQRQPSLTRLWINASTILPASFTDAPLPKQPLKITHLDLDQCAWEGRTTNLISVHEERLKGVDPALLALTVHPESIRSVSVPRRDTALHLLSILAKIEPDIPYMLSSLTIPYSSTDSEDFVSSLVSSTSLKELRLLPPQEDTIHSSNLQETLPASSIPHLEIYQGPYHLLPAFSNAHRPHPRRLRSVELWGLDEPVDMTVCDPHRLEAVLEELVLCDEAVRALERFNALVTHVTIDLMTVLTRFPNLKEISLESQDSLIPNRPTPTTTSAMELSQNSSISMLYDLFRSRVLSPSLKHVSLVTHLKNTTTDDTATQYIEAASFLESLGQENPHIATFHVRYGTYWTGVVDISWQRRAPLRVQMPDDEWPQTTGQDIVQDASINDVAKTPPLSRSSTLSFVSNSSDSSQAAVNRFFALPSRPKSTTAIIHLPLGDMAFTEQKRAVVLPERVMPPEPPKVDGPRLGWLAGGVSRVWYLVERVGRILGEGVGIAQNWR